MKEKIFSTVIQLTPDFMIWLLLPLLRKIIPAESNYEDLLITRFAAFFARHYNTVVEKTQKTGRYMYINKGRFEYSFFNICFLNNVIGLIIYAFYMGYLPVVQIESKEDRQCIWDWHFRQPFIAPADVDAITCDRTYTNYRPSILTGFGNDEKDFNIWSFFYKKFVILNEATSQYVQQELKKAGVHNNSLGLLIRGTDYTGLRPKGHPIQPDIEELIEKASEYHKEFNYSAIYVATDEKRLFDAVVEAFGSKLVRENNRSYYDEQYYQQRLEYIGQVKFNRDRDNYWKGLEYLSSIVILSHCTDLIAGNCGGTEFAVLFTEGYRNKYIFDKGLY